MMRMLLMAASEVYRQQHGGIREVLPDIDFVYVHNDGDPNPTRGWVCPAPWPEACEDMMLPMMTNGLAGRGSSSIPLPDFSWVGWNTHTPPWCELGRQMAAAALLTSWENRTQLAYFSGGLRSGNSRLQLKALYEKDPDARRLLKARGVS